MKKILLIFFTVLFLVQTSNAQEKPTDQSLRNIVDAKNPETYKYIVGQSPDEFKDLLNEWGEKGYKYFMSTKIPLEDSEQSYKQMILAAILKYDGEEKFKYELFAATDTYNAENFLNKFSQQGFRYRKSFWFTEGMKDSGNCDGDETSQILCRASKMNGIRTGSVILMESGSGKKTSKTYKVLTGGGRKIFIWDKSSAANLKEIFDDTLKESFFIPVGLFFYQLNFYDAVIVEITDAAEIEPKLQAQISYKVVRHELGGRFNKEIETLSKDDYQIILKEKNFAVLARNENDRNQVTYTIVAAHRKKYLEEISRLANQGYKFSLVDYDHHSVDQFEGKILFEKNVKDDGRRFEYKSVKLTEKPQYPNETVKQRIVYPAPETAINELKKLTEEGYKIRALFYSHGIAALLEKEINPSSTQNKK